MKKLSNKNKIITFRVNDKEKYILDKLCKKYDKKPSNLIIFLLEREYYYSSKEDDKNA